MSQTERERVAKLLAEIGEAIDETRKVLQDDDEMGMVQDLISAYQQDGNDLGENPVSDFLEWLRGADDADIDAAEDVIDAFMQTVDADDPSAVSVEGLAGWLQESMGDGEEADEDDEGDGGQTMSEEDLEEAVSTIGQFADRLDTVKDMLTEYREETERELEELREEKTDLERRLQEIEDEPQPRSLAGPKDTDFVDTDGGGDSGDTHHEDVMM